jgi:hypothetical protein
MSDPRIGVRLRRRIAARAGHRCEYCLSPESVSLSSFAVDHIHPKSKGGDSSDANLAYGCSGCNSWKSNRTEGLDPLTGEFAPLFHPRTDRWSEHFAWSADLLSLVGISPTGRVTVDALHLNRAGLRTLRRLMLTNGLHPTSALELPATNGGYGVAAEEAE